MPQSLRCVNQRKVGLNEVVQSDRFYFKNLPDMPREVLTQLSYWIQDAEEGGYNLYYRDRNGEYKVRHFFVIAQGQYIENINGGPFESLEAFIGNSYTHCYGEKMEVDQLLCSSPL